MLILWSEILLEKLKITQDVLKIFPPLLGAKGALPYSQDANIRASSAR
jgi:hypothetical protein